MDIIGIIATIGPASADARTLLGLKAAGMTVARLNGSHSDLEWHRSTIGLLRATLPDTPILLDIPGRKIRTTALAVEPSFKTGATVILTTDLVHDGSAKVPVSLPNLHEQLYPGVTIFADDGTLSFTVTEVIGRDIHVRAAGDGTLRSRKGINIPEVKLSHDLVTERDRSMVRFAKDNGIDYIGISFVESSAHISAIRDLIGTATPRIVAKIENQGGLDNLEDVVTASDVVMIDRGDLAVETDLDQVSLHQKRIVEACHAHGKPVIIATELLHTMIENPYPTKAEIGDITNAVMDGAGLLMLSGETAIGRYPVEAVARLRSVSTAVGQLRKHHAATGAPTNALAQAIRAAARACSATGIMVLSRNGQAVGIAAAALTGLPIIALHPDADFVRTLGLLPGVRGVHFPYLDWNAVGVQDGVIRALVACNAVAHEDLLLMVTSKAVAHGTGFDSMHEVRVAAAH